MHAKHVHTTQHHASGPNVQSAQRGERVHRLGDGADQGVVAEIQQLQFVQVTKRVGQFTGDGVVRQVPGKRTKEG